MIELMASGVSTAVTKAHAILAGWRKRYGQEGYEALKQRLFGKIQHLALEPQQQEQLRQRVSEALDRAGQ